MTIVPDWLPFTFSDPWTAFPSIETPAVLLTAVSVP
jgi:hypothetical protein